MESRQDSFALAWNTCYSRSLGESGELIGGGVPVCRSPPEGTHDVGDGHGVHAGREHHRDQFHRARPALLRLHCQDIHAQDRHHQLGVHGMAGSTS
jgi:hypothetical protein